MNCPIFLCGFMSSGKTTLGKRLANRLSLPFYDTDQLLIEKNNMTVQEIFAKGGESLFRDLEHEIAKGVCTLGPCVVSTGGGMLTFERNAELLAAHGMIICIERPFEDCYQSLSRQPDRPLFKNHTKDEVEQIYHEREAKYLAYASYVIKNDGSPEDAVERILTLLKD